MPRKKTNRRRSFPIQKALGIEPRASLFLAYQGGSGAAYRPFLAILVFYCSGPWNQPSSPFLENFLKTRTLRLASPKVDSRPGKNL